VGSKFLLRTLLKTLIIRDILFKIHILGQSISKSYYNMMGSKFLFRKYPPKLNQSRANRNKA
jgi:hypothetical protein